MKLDATTLAVLGLLGFAAYKLFSKPGDPGLLPNVGTGRNQIPRRPTPGTPPIVPPVGGTPQGGGGIAGIAGSAVSVIQSLGGLFRSDRATGQTSTATAPESQAYTVGPNYGLYENTGTSFQPIGGILGPTASNPIGVPDVDIPFDQPLDLGAPDFGSDTALA